MTPIPAGGLASCSTCRCSTRPLRTPACLYLVRCFFPGFLGASLEGLVEAS